LTVNRSPSPGKSLKTPNDGSPSKDHGTRFSCGNQILEWIDETFDLIVYPTGFEDCIVGVGERYGGPPVAVLDVAKMLAKMEKEGMTHDEALEYFEYNILGAYVGEESPVYLHIPDFRVEKNQTRKGKTQE
jgi:hypothetical protein